MRGQAWKCGELKLVRSSGVRRSGVREKRDK